MSGALDTLHPSLQWIFLARDSVDRDFRPSEGQ